MQADRRGSGAPEERPSPATKFLYQLIQLWQKDNPGHFPTLHDPLAVGTALRASLIETQTGTVHVETASPAFYGANVFTPGAGGSTKVAQNVNVREFLDLFMERVTAPSR